MARRKRTVVKKEVKTKKRTSLTERLRTNATKAFGKDNVPDMEEFDNSVYGIPIQNNLPLQFLLGVDIWPLSRFTTVVGKESTSKSGFTYYLGTQFAKQGYPYLELHTEGKQNPDQIKGTFQNDELFYNQFIPLTAGSLDQLIEECNGIKKFYEEECPNNEEAMLLTLDSLACVTRAEFMKDSQEEGANHDPGYGPAKAALMWQEHLKVYGPSFISKCPVAFVMINHQKSKLGGANPHVKSEAGGSHKEFNWVSKLSFRRASRNKTLSQSKDIIKIKNEKSALGVTDRMISVEYIITLQKGDIPNTFEYNWDKALVQLLLSKDVSTADLKKVLNIVQSGTKYTCKEVGITKGTQEEIGKAIHADKELIKRLQEDVLYIKRKPKYLHGKIISANEYSKKVAKQEKAREKAKEKSDELKAEISES